VQAYNAQVVVDSIAQVIVAEAVTNQPPDVEHLEPLLERVRGNLGKMPARLTADTGYYRDSNVEYCDRQAIGAYLSVGRAKHRGQPNPNATARTTPTRARMLAKLKSPMGRQLYSRRKTIAEPPFGQIQSARGFRRFSLRGLGKVRCEWSRVCLTHNLLKLFRMGWLDRRRPWPGRARRRGVRFPGLP
jgi:hypothetical protein